jgi:response regulator RpfG family c-di-GMP phosphodiesterase
MSSTCINVVHILSPGNFAVDLVHKGGTLYSVGRISFTLQILHSLGQRTLVGRALRQKKIELGRRMCS